MAYTAHEKTPLPWKRYLGVAAVLVAVVALFIIAFLPGMRIQRWIADLHALNPQTVAAAHKNLRDSKDPDLDDKLAAGMADAGLAFPVRLELGRILLERSRLPTVEKVLAGGDRAGRRAALAALYSQIGQRGFDWFTNDYVKASQFHVEETLLDWFDADKDSSRVIAAQIAGTIDLRSAVPKLRGLVQAGDKLGTTKPQRMVLSAAAHALLKLGDCEAVASFVEPAMHESDDVIRLRMLQALHRAVRGPQPLCPDAVAEEDVKAAVIAALDGPSNTRQGALLLLKNEPAWAAEVEEKLLDILDHAPTHEFHRRHALDALVAVGNPAFGRRLLRYFHDADQYVRSEAAMASRTLGLRPDAPVQYVDVWIGLLENERENQNVFRTALSTLHDRATQWVALPPELKAAAARGKPAWIDFRDGLFRSEASHGLSREAWSEAWWRWWAESLGLDEAEQTAGWAARQAFWKAARQGDADAARRALEASPRQDDGLFTYEQGWLDAQSK